MPFVVLPMKLLMIHTTRFAYRTGHKSLDDVPENNATADYSDALVGFIHAEAEDVDNAKKVETKLVKNLKWGARKNGTSHIILHSFSHLSESKAPADFTKDLFDRCQQRLEEAGYRTEQTPFGYFLDLELAAPGLPTARIFTSF